MKYIANSVKYVYNRTFVICRRAPESSEMAPLNAVYEINYASPDDEGSYTCQAVNTAGTIEERVYVRIDDDNEVYPPCRGDVPCTDDKQRPPAAGSVRNLLHNRRWYSHPIIHKQDRSKYLNDSIRIIQM